MCKGNWPGPFGRSSSPAVSACFADNPSLRTPGISYAPWIFSGRSAPYGGSEMNAASIWVDPFVEVSSSSSTKKQMLFTMGAKFSTVFDNQYATGGLAVLAGGVFQSALRSHAQLFCDAVADRLPVRAEFDSRDDSYRWLLAWLMTHPHYAAGDRYSVLTTLKRVGAAHR